MPVIKNNTDRVLTLSDFDNNYIDVYPGNSITTPYFYTTISGADVTSESPYYEEIVDYVVASGTESEDFSTNISSETDYIMCYNTTANNIMVYLNAKSTNGYVVPANDSYVIDGIRDMVRRLYVSFSTTVDSGVYVYEYKNPL